MEEKLILEHMNLAYWMANQFRSTGIDPEELRSVALLGLVKASKSYLEERGVKFSSYAAMVMKYEILMYLRKEKKHQKEKCMLQDEVCEGVTLEETISDPRKFEKEVHDRLMIQELIDCLTEKERSIVCMVYLDHMKQDEVGKLLGMKQPTVSRILKKIKILGGGIPCRNNRRL